MSDLSAIAQAAVQIFPNVAIATSVGTIALPVAMVAIAGSESCGWNDQAVGDCGYGGPSCGICTCGPGQGGTSWGAWQIHNVHSAYLQGATGSADPCVWHQWLSIPLNCARAALAIYQGPGGLGNWSTWRDGSWKKHLPLAQTAVQAAQNLGLQPVPILPVLAGWAVLALFSVGAILVGVGELEGWNLGELKES